MFWSLVFAHETCIPSTEDELLKLDRQKFKKNYLSTFSSSNRSLTTTLVVTLQSTLQLVQTNYMLSAYHFYCITLIMNISKYPISKKVTFTAWPTQTGPDRHYESFLTTHLQDWVIMNSFLTHITVPFTFLLSSNSCEVIRHYFQNTNEVRYYSLLKASVSDTDTVGILITSHQEKARLMELVAICLLLTQSLSVTE